MCIKLDGDVLTQRVRDGAKVLGLLRCLFKLCGIQPRDLACYLKLHARDLRFPFNLFERANGGYP